MLKIKKKQKRYIYTTLFFKNDLKFFTYYSDIPLPRVGEEIQFEGFYSVVENIKHMTHGNTTEIRIQCK